MNHPTDANGNFIKLDDRIVYIAYKGSHPKVGIVVGFTPKKVRCLKEGISPTTTHTYGGTSYTYRNSVNVDPTQILVIKDL